MGQNLNNIIFGTDISNSPNDAAWKKFLHIFGMDLNDGAIVSDGEGNESALELHTDKIRVIGDVEVTGSITAGGQIGALMGENEQRVDLINDQQVLGVTLTDVYNFELLPVEDSTYLFEIILLLETDNASWGHRYSIQGDAIAMESLSYSIITPGNATQNDYDNRDGYDIQLTTGAAPFADSPILLRVSGYLKTNNYVPASPVSIKIGNENAAGTTTIRKGSSMVFRKL